jgi:hypothetical protein
MGKKLAIIAAIAIIAAVLTSGAYAIMCGDCSTCSKTSCMQSAAPMCPADANSCKPAPKCGGDASKCDPNSKPAPKCGAADPNHAKCGK